MALVYNELMEVGRHNKNIQWGARKGSEVKRSFRGNQKESSHIDGQTRWNWADDHEAASNKWFQVYIDSFNFAIAEFKY